MFIFTGFSEKMSLGWFIFQQVVLLGCVLPIKVKRGGRPYTFTANLNAFYLQLLLYGGDQTKRFTLFYARLIHLSLRILFLSLKCIIFLLLLIKYEQ